MTRSQGPVEPWALAAIAAGWCVSGTTVPGAGVAVVPTGLLAAGLLVSASVVAQRRGTRSQDSDGLVRLLAGVALVVALVVAGSVVRATVLRSPSLDRLAQQGGRVEASLVVVAEPRVGEGGWWAIVRLEELAGAPIRSRATLRGHDEPPVLWSRWQGPVTARPLGSTGFDQYVATLHAQVHVTAVEPGQWRPPALLGRVTEGIRDRVRRGAGAEPRDARALVVGLATGDSRLLSRASQADLRSAGLSHLTAVSGANVAIVVVAVVALASFLALSPPIEAGLLIVALLGFALLTRFEPSVLRATAMAVVVVGARLRGTLADARRGLAVVVLGLVVIDPMLARSLGLLLSAAATWGLLVLRPRVRARLGWLPIRVADAVAVAIAAQLGVTPILLLGAGQVRLADVVANLVAVPLAAGASLVGVVGAVLAAVKPGLGEPVIAVAAVPASGVLAVARAFAGRGPVLDAAQPLLLAAGLSAGLWVLSRPRTRVAHTLAAMALACATLAQAPAMRWQRPTDAMRVTAIDVGQGDAILVETPDVAVMVDGGGDDAAATWLRRHRIDQVDLLVASHLHLDHVGGLPAVVAVVDVGQYWYRSVPVDLPQPAAVVVALRERGVPIHQPGTGQSARFGATTIDVLGPPAGRPYEYGESELNDTSLILRVRWAGRAVLLTGDAEVSAQRDLLRRPDLLRADVLKVAHHGGATSDPALLDAVAPSIALVSVGTDNRYGHPAPATLDGLAAHRAVVRRTDLEGTVTIELPATDRIARGVDPLGWAAPATPRAVVATDRRRAGTELVSGHGRCTHCPPRRQRRRPPVAARHRGRRRQAHCRSP